MVESAGKDLPQEEQFIQRIKALRSEDVNHMGAIIGQAGIGKLRRTDRLLSIDIPCGRYRCL